MSEPIHRGGCQCGAIRFVATGRPENAAYCHCRICQRTTGAPVTVWADWDVKRFRFTSREQPAVYASSATGRRWFCQVCGAAIAFIDTKAPRIVELNVVALDEPALVPPDHHSWASARLPWLEIADDLLRHPEDAPSPGLAQK